MEFTVILTSYKEEKSVKKAIECILPPNKNIWNKMQLIIVAPDSKTLESAKSKIAEYKGYKDFLVLRDKAKGKPAALNLAVENAKNEILILTDGDMYVSDNAIKDLVRYFEAPRVGGVSGHPISLDNKNTQFGYYSHLFCEAAHTQRLKKDFVPMSGYLYAMRKIKGMFPLPEEIRAEDAYISEKVMAAGYDIKYDENSIAYVHFPKNLKDWVKQKTRSLGGNIQTKNFIPAEFPHKNRSITQDLQNALFPLNYASTPKEYLYSLALYPLRLYLWIKIYFQHYTGTYSKGLWERIESSKN